MSVYICALKLSKNVCNQLLGAFFQLGPLLESTFSSVIGKSRVISILMAGLKTEPGVYCWNVHSIDYAVYFVFVDVCVCLCVRPSMCVCVSFSLCGLVRLCDEWQTCEQSAQKFSLFLQFACSLGKAIALKKK